MTTHFWAVPKIGTPAIQIDIDPEALGRNYPLGAAVNGDAKVTLARMLGAGRPRERGQAQGLGRRGAGDLQGVAGKIQIRARIRRGADPARAHLPRAHATHAGRRHRGRRHRPRRHVDGRHVRSSRARARATCAAPAISAGRSRRASAPNAPVPTGRSSTFTGDAGFLVPHRRDRDGGALEHQRRDRRQQQWRRQPVEARLRPRLWRQADRRRRASCGPSAK